MIGIGELARRGGVSPRTLRHYGELGLLVPARIDAATGYRSYEPAQLDELRRIIELRDLGLRLQEIQGLVAGKTGADELRDVLVRRRAEVAGAIDEERERLRRIEEHLRALVPRARVEPGDPPPARSCRPPSPQPGPILVVTGPSAVGKTTVSRLVASAFASSAHLQGDDFLYAVVGGWVPPWLPEAADQHEVVGTAMAVASIAFAESGSTTLLDGHLFPPGVRGLTEGCAARGIAVHCVVLRADLDVCLGRARRREPSGSREATPPADLEPLMADLHARYADLGPLAGHTVDAVGEPDDVAVAVLEAFRSGRLRVR